MSIVTKIFCFLHKKLRPISEWSFPKKCLFSGLGLCLLAYYFCLPSELFRTPYATAVYSQQGKLLGAKIAPDGQWRFPASEQVPEKIKQCVLAYEDAYFYYHWGVNPISMGKAFWRNTQKGKVVRGGSTLTQQVIRLSRQNPARTYTEKALEALLATRLEFRYSKEKILSLYLSHAPFGGNVVGMQMAAWRYFGLPPEKLSWAESALLAVLPNAPSLIYPGKNHLLLKEKRNFLLKKLFQQKIIDQQTLELSLLEPLPEKPHPLPQIAPHLVEKIAQERQGHSISTTIDYFLQENVNRIVQKYYHRYQQSEIYNIAVLVSEVQTQKVLCYVGNAPTDAEHQKDVNIIHAPRSTGSILKPFLFAAMLSAGELLPTELVPDIPTQISGYAPENFSRSYQGAVPADQALYKSLNIPFVRLLQRYGVERFYQDLQKLHLSDLNKSPEHYGLSLILGGGESNLWDLCRAYGALARELNHFSQSGKSAENPWANLHFYPEAKNLPKGKNLPEKTHFNVGAIWQTLQTLTQVNRPEHDAAWRHYPSARQISWKTGTSFGNRDAWAIGVTPTYVVGVWVGNASGEGRPALTGVGAAAPLLFDVFGQLPKEEQGFQPPWQALYPIEICAQSGFLASEICPKKTLENAVQNVQGGVCPYHKRVHLSRNGDFQVNTSCETLSNMVTQSWFVLPPVMEWFYKKTHLNYASLPPFRPDCLSQQPKNMEFIYPKHKNILHRAKDFGGKELPIVARLAYNGKGKIFWYLDADYLGHTEHFHQMPLSPTAGTHLLQCTDEQGNEKIIEITVR